MAQLGLPSAASRPAPSAKSGFNLASSSSSSDAGSAPAASVNGDGSTDDDDDEALPFPAALSRRDFLAPDFDPAAYLSALHTGGPTARHQTLEDLRAELRDRSAAISAELLELVNANYTAFLGLGDELRGGEERVEDVRVALLGFRRAVEEVQARVRERRAEVGTLSEELRDVRAAVETGRRMLELDDRIAGLETRLVVGSAGQVKRKVSTDKGSDGNDNDDDDDYDDDFLGEESDEDEEDEGDAGSGFVGRSPAKLSSLARDYVVLGRLADSLGRDLPFVKKMEERMMRCRNTILLDLGTATKEARNAGPRGQTRVLKFMAIYRTLDAQTEAVQVFKK